MKSKHNVIRAVTAWGPAAAWAAVLFLLSHLSGGTASSLDLLPDKLAHGILYTVLGGTLAWGWRTAPASPPPLVLFLLGIAYGILDEWHQSFVPGRDASAGDLLADAAGLAVGLLLFGIVLASRFPRSGDLRTLKPPPSP